MQDQNAHYSFAVVLAYPDYLCDSDPEFYTYMSSKSTAEQAIADARTVAGMANEPFVKSPADFIIASVLSFSEFTKK